MCFVDRGRLCGAESTCEFVILSVGDVRIVADSIVKIVGKPSAIDGMMKYLPISPFKKREGV